MTYARQKAEAMARALGYDTRGGVSQIADALEPFALEAMAYERELNAAEAIKGGCSCDYAPCEHDDAGRAIAARIRALPPAPEVKP